MRVFRSLILAGISLGALSNPALAQNASAEEGAVADDGTIIVQARRRGESIQDVPQTVNVVTSEAIDKLRIFSAGDVASVVPGISIESSSAGSGGFGQSQGIRGVPTFQTANATPTVQFYLNDAPASSGLTSLL